MVAELGVVEEHLVLFKALWGVDIVVVCIVTDRDVRRSDDIFDEARGLVLVGEDDIGRGNA